MYACSPDLHRRLFIGRSHIGNPWQRSGIPVSTFPGSQTRDLAGRPRLALRFWWEGSSSSEHGQRMRLYASVRGIGEIISPVSRKRARGSRLSGKRFRRQEPWSNKEIAQFCQLNYGVTFPMFAKTSVVGANANPLYRALITRTGQPPRWNFHKYFLDRTGQPVAVFDSAVEPADPRITSQIERLLAAR